MDGGTIPNPHQSGLAAFKQMNQNIQIKKQPKSDLLVLPDEDQIPINQN
jgi:hypothetical protein